MVLPNERARFTAIRAVVQSCGWERIPKSTAGYEYGDEDVRRTLPRDKGLHIVARMQKIPIFENTASCSERSSMALVARGMSSMSGIS